MNVSEIPFQKGVAVVRETAYGPALSSFHKTMEAAAQVLSRTIDLVPLVLSPAEVWFADNGNVRLWRPIAIS